MTLDDLRAELKTYAKADERKLVERAYDFAAAAHEGQQRLSGEPYIQHPIAAAVTIAKFRLPAVVVAATLLHDVPEDTSWTLDDIEKEFGQEIATLVGGVTKLGKVKYRGVERYLESLRHMFVAMARDIRVILIKFADRLHNLQTLEALPPHKQKRIAVETLEIYAPIAQRLGMGQLFVELEDLAFRYANPEAYARVTALIAEPMREKERLIKVVWRELEELLGQYSHIRVRFFDGRTKHLHSLYRKLAQLNWDLTKVYDLVALRVIVERVQDCYAVLGVIHERWKPLPGRIKDYIAQPKPNGYQSLHTTVFTPRAGIVEIQIRTQEMHDVAEYGAAAHWRYKQSIDQRAFEKRYHWIKDVVQRTKNSQDTSAYLQSLKVDVFRNQIYVFTPKGDVIELPEESTPVDFAYSVHTDLGNRCTWARVNDHVVKLDTQLKSGDIVEILTNPQRRKPDRKWLAFVKTPTAREHIRHALRS